MPPVQISVGFPQYQPGNILSVPSLQTPFSPSDVQIFSDILSERLIDDTPTTSEVIGAAFQTYNSFWTTAKESIQLQSNPSLYLRSRYDWYNPEEDMQAPLWDVNRYDEFFGYLSTAVSPVDMVRLKKNVERAILHRDIIERSTTIQAITGIGLAVLTDPLSWFAPFKFFQTGSLAKNILRASKSGAKYATGQVAIQESLLRATSPGIRPEESLIALGIAPIAGATLAGLFAAIKGRPSISVLSARTSAANQKYSEELTERYLSEVAGNSEVRFTRGIGDDPFFDPFARHGGTSLGIDPNRYPFGIDSRRPRSGKPLNQPGILGSPSNIGIISKGVAFISPGFRGRTSPTPPTVSSNELLVESGIIALGSTKGIARPIPVETRLKMWSATLAERTADVRNSWYAYRFRIANELGKRTTPKEEWQYKKVPRTSMGLRISDIIDKARGKEPLGLSNKEFNFEVTSVLLGDTSKIKEINSIAKVIRKDLDYLFDEEVSVGILSKEDFIDNYVPRLWNIPMVKERFNELTNIIRNWQKENLPTERRLSSKEIKNRLTQIFRSPDGLERGILEPEDIASIKQSMKEAKESSAIGLKGVFKQRTIEVDDRVISDFISQDIDEILRSYWRLATADIEIVRSFGNLSMSSAIKSIRDWGIKRNSKYRHGRIGNVDIKLVVNPENKAAFFRGSNNTIYLDITQINKLFDRSAWKNPKVKGVAPLDSKLFLTRKKWQEFVLFHEYAHSLNARGADETLGQYENRMNKIALNFIASEKASGEKYKNAINPRALKVEERISQDIRDLEGMRDILRGVYGIPEDPYSPSSRAARLALEFNNWIVLGGATISSLPNIARIPMVAGMATIPMLKAMLTDFPAFKKAAAEIPKAGTALDMQLNTRAIALTGIGDLPQRFTKLERGAGYVTNAFFLANLLSPWNAFIKKAAGTAIGHDILELSEQWATGTISKDRRTKMANAYISKKDAIEINEQFIQHGEIVKDLRIPNTSKWTNDRAVTKFRAALVHDVDMAIVTPGAGDQPLFAHKIWGRIITQYKSFLFAAATKVMVPGMQQKDSRTLLGLMMMIFTGGLVSNLKDIQNNRPPSQNVFDFLFDGIDQSGVTSWFMNVHQGVEAATNNQIGVRKLLGTEPPYGPSPSWKMGQLSPLAGTGVKISDFMSRLASGGMDSRTRMAAYKLIPFNNVFWLKALRDLRYENLQNVSSWMNSTHGENAEELTTATKRQSLTWKSRKFKQLSDYYVNEKGLSRRMADKTADALVKQIILNRKAFVNQAKNQSKIDAKLD